MGRNEGRISDSGSEIVVENLSGEGGRGDCVVASVIWLETLLLRNGENTEEAEFGLGKCLVVTEGGTSIWVIEFVVGFREAVLIMGFDLAEDT